MTKPSPKPQEEPDGPAIVTELHAQDRPATDDDFKAILGKLAWKKLTKLAVIFDRGQLRGPKEDKDPEHRRRFAGEYYIALFDAWQPPSTDSSQKLNISRSTGGDAGSANRMAAGNAIAAFKKHLGGKDRRILEFVFEHDYWPAEAVKMVTADYEDERPARFREALDGLWEAIKAARRDALELSRRRLKIVSHETS